MSASSVSTTASRSFSRYSAARSAISSGIGPGSPSLPPSGLVYAHMCRTSTIPVSSCSAPIGMCTATHFVESWFRSASSVRKKSARSRSSMFTKTTRARPSSSASLQARDVPTSTPMTAETVTSAPSTTRAAHRSSPWNAGSPGTSIRLTFRSCHVGVLERHRDRELALVLVLVRVGDRRARLDRAEAVDRARLEEERLDERRLSRPAVADDGDVADLCGLGHGLALLLGACGFRPRSLVRG